MIRNKQRNIFGSWVLALLLGGLFLSSCKKPEKYSIIPEIEYKSFEKIPNNSGSDNKAYLTITFTDGDSDIGLKSEDTIPPYNIGGKYYYNYFIDYYELQGDTFVKIDLPISNNSRIPYVEPNLAELGIKGEVQIELYINNIMSTADSIRYELYILDRALHKSNVIVTPSFYIKK
ncbi:MAG: hypothetical protein KAG64_07760 [Bacteroidales bacterium]|nr:hypothetical protein [Bacteroidales bacterium]